MRRVVAALFAVLLTAVPAAAQTPLKIMVGGIDKQIYLPARLAAQLGFFKEQGLDVELFNSTSGSQAATALLAREVQGVVGFYDHTIDLQSKGKFITDVVQFSVAPGEVVLVKAAEADKLKDPAVNHPALLTRPDQNSTIHSPAAIQAKGDDYNRNPVGTGPFRLGTWRRSSLIVLEKNPQFRDMRWASQPAADDVEGQRWNQQFGACKLPLVDRVEVSVMEASQPRFLAFMGGEIDVLVTPLDFVPMVMPRGELAPHLSRKGVRARVYLNPDVVYSQFNMKDPVVGGLAPERVALRRAISLALDPQREIQLVRRGQAIPAQGPLQPHTYGFELQGRSSMAEFNVAKARALLDLYGYVDRDGDGWRDQPDGKPLVLEVATQPDSLSRQFDELWLKGMSDLGIRVTFLTGQWAEQLKMARAGKLMIWQLAQTA